MALPTYSTVVVGPWGNHGGSPWTYMAAGKICNITVTYDANAIHSIKFTSIKKDGTFDFSDVYGGTNGSQKKEITIYTKVDELDLIEGTIGIYNSIRTVTSLAFTTRTKQQFGPYGSAKGTPFQLRLSTDSFGGFSGTSDELLKSIGVQLLIKTGELLPPAGNLEPGDVPWSFAVSKGTISRIIITYDDNSIYSLAFTSKDAQGTIYQSNVFGDQLTGTKKEIEIDTNVEKLIGIRGTTAIISDVGGNKRNELASLEFITDNDKSFGPFGSEADTEFSSVVVGGGGERVTGFYGIAKSLISSIGICTQPISSPSTAVGPTIGTSGYKWSFDPKGPITRIILTYNRLVCQLKFNYLDENGNPQTSSTFGSQTGTKTKVIDIDPKSEKIVGISGFIIDENASWKIISALSFYTDKKKIYGPYGTKRGSEFSYPVKSGGYISGFHGESIGTLCSIGIYVKPPVSTSNEIQI